MSRRRNVKCDSCPLQTAHKYFKCKKDQDGFKMVFVNSYKGCGVFTTKPFSKGEFLLEYQGELLDRSEGERRMELYPLSAGSFLYFFDFRKKHYCLDATYRTNELGRMVNDSKKPNSKMRVIELEGKPHLALFALRPININEEILFNYGDPTAFWRKEKAPRDLFKCPDGVEKIEKSEESIAGRRCEKTTEESEPSGTRCEEKREESKAGTRCEKTSDESKTRCKEQRDESITSGTKCEKLAEESGTRCEEKREESIAGTRCEKTSEESETSGTKCQETMEERETSGTRCEEIREKSIVGTRCKKTIEESETSGTRYEEIREESIAGARCQKTMEESETSGTRCKETMEESETSGARCEEIREESETSGTRCEEMREESETSGTRCEKTMEGNETSGTRCQKTMEESETSGTRCQKTMEESENSGTRCQKTMEESETSGTRCKETMEESETSGARCEEIREESETSGTRCEEIREESKAGTSCKKTMEESETSGTSCQKTMEESETSGTRCKETMEEIETSGARCEEIREESIAGTRCKKTMEESENNGTRCEKTMEESETSGTRCEKTMEESETSGTRCEKAMEESETSGTRCEKTMEEAETSGTRCKETMEESETIGTRCEEIREESIAGTRCENTMEESETSGTRCERTMEESETSGTRCEKTMEETETNGTRCKETMEESETIGTRCEEIREESIAGTRCENTMEDSETSGTRCEKTMEETETSGTRCKETMEESETIGTRCEEIREESIAGARCEETMEESYTIGTRCEENQITRRHKNGAEWDKAGIDLLDECEEICTAGKQTRYEERTKESQASVTSCEKRVEESQLSGKSEIIFEDINAADGALDNGADWEIGYIPFHEEDGNKNIDRERLCNSRIGNAGDFEYKCSTDAIIEEETIICDSDESNGSVEYPMLSCASENMNVLTDECDNISIDSLDSVKYEQNKKDSDIEFINDINNTGLFMPALKHNRVSKRGVGKKHSRVWNKRHACYYCGALVTNISKHLRTYREKVEIKAILDMESNSALDKERVKSDVKFQLSLLKNKGDHKHNISVLDGGKGHLIVARRNDLEEFNADDYAPCPYCLLWIKESDMYKHKVYGCLFKSSKNKNSNRHIVNQARILKGSIFNSSHRVVDQVFPSMTRDLISRTAQNDIIIVELGEEWVRKASRNKLRRNNYASTHMRRAAKVLHICRVLDAQDHSKDPAVSFMEFLIPSKFDLVVTAAVKVAGCTTDETDDTMLHPSAAIKFGHDLVRMCESKEAMGIKRGDQAMRSEANDFLILLSKEWPSKVAITSQRITEERRYKKKLELPPVEDLKTLSQYLQRELTAFTGCLDSVSWETYQRVIKLIQTRLVTYNKRRPGELEAMTLESYHLRHTSTDVLQKDILEDLSILEKRLHQSHDLVTVRGKRGASVPVLIPPDVKKVLEYVADEGVRNSPEIQIKEENQHYLFANSGRGVFRVCDSLRELRRECNVELGLHNPELLSCTLLRKYMATATQMLSVNDQELSWIVKHLGHSVTVHDQYYRIMSSTLERSKIAKLLVLADQGMLGKFKGQSLEELNFDDIQLQNEHPSKSPIGHVVDVSLGDIADDPQSEDDNQPDTQRQGDKSDDDDDDDDDDDVEDEEPPCKKKKNLPWSSGESREVEGYFEEQLKNLKIPGKTECEAYLEFSRCKANRKRTWLEVKNKVYAIIQREKRRRER